MKPSTHSAAGRAAALLLCGIAAMMPSARAQTPLADGPLFAATNVPGNLGLVLSVEFPTAISVAHTNRTYINTSEYLGFFDPGKCYEYRYTDGTSTTNYFYPSGLAAANHICTGKWSGNFLNWASMQTIDPFRWVLTGGYRVIDDAALTVIEKAWGTNQGNNTNFPDSTISGASLAGATPFPASALGLYMRVWGMGNKMRFTLPVTSGVTFTGKYYNNTTWTGTPVLTRTDAAVDFDWGTGSPDPAVNVDNFSVDWTATVAAPSAGNYQFQVAGDDRVQLYVDGVRVVNQTSYQNWTYQNSGTIAATAGHVFSIEVKMSEDGGGAGARLQWMKPGDAGFSTLGGITSVASLYTDSLATAYNSPSATVAGSVYDVFIRAKVCDSSGGSGGVEANCTAYGSNWKPEGLMQKYANKIRYSAFGYLNDSNIQRDGGVLRARQKYVGPMQPNPGSVATTNPLAEWDASTGVFVRNPDSADAATTSTLIGSTLADSGVLNYLNKFGASSHSYKTYDNVSELYYAAIRYFKRFNYNNPTVPVLGNVPEWSNMSGQSVTTKTAWADGFPVITTWDDPIQYSCQRNFLLGIGDVDTHADKNLPGNTDSTNEPPMPAGVTADTTVNAVTATNKVGELEGMGSSLGTTYVGTGTSNSYNMAGLAYDAHTVDIRPLGAGHLATDRTTWQTIDTYWVDVQEYQRYITNNQFYLATKYGGFKVPAGYSPYTRTTALDESWWHTNTDTFNTTQKRPDNYFSGGRPDLMKAGLETAFADIASKITAYTTSFSTSLPQVSTAGNKSYSSLYDASNWTGEIVASELSFATGSPVLTEAWKFSTYLGTQLAGTGWDVNRRVVTWGGSGGVQFCTTASNTTCAAPITSTQLSALNSSYVTGDDSTNYLRYLRGDKTNEQASTGGTKAYRTRASLLGDIVGSKARPVGPPSFPFADGANPGYSAFKTTWATRPTVVYVGANDGMMHAIQGDLTVPSGARELFAYVPAAMFQGPTATPNTNGLAALGNPAFVHHFMVNATPNVYDVDFARTPDAAGLPRTGTADWHSILIGGLGKGGRSYYAIDVTDPVGMSVGTSGGEAAVAGKVLWEFTDSDLGYTYGDPIVVKTVKYGWVVIVPSGYNATDGAGHLLILNPRTGALLEKVSTGAGSPTTDAGLAFANAFVLDSSDGTADAVYAGDLLGNLWRWDITAGVGTAYPAPLKIATFTASSGGAAQPVTSRPVIEVHPTLKKRFVMVGTGRLLDTTDIASTQVQSFYAIMDGTNARFNTAADLPTSVNFPITKANLANNVNALDTTTHPTTAFFDMTTQMGWYEDMGTDSSTGIGWRVTSDATTLLGSVAWAATVPNGDACSPSGNSRVYGRDFAAATSTVQTLQSGTLAAALYVSIAGNVTDLRYLSVNGKATLISGTDKGSLQKIDINPTAGLGLRRLNWRELQTVE